MVATHGHRALPAQARHDLVGIRAVADGVAQDPQGVVRRERLEHRLEGGQVGMDVREDGDAHAAGQRSRGRRPPESLSQALRPCWLAAAALGRWPWEARRRRRAPCARPPGGDRASAPADTGCDLGRRAAQHADGLRRCSQLPDQRRPSSRFQHTSSPPTRSSGRASSAASASEPTARTVTTSQALPFAGEARHGPRRARRATRARGAGSPAAASAARHGVSGHRQEARLLAHRVDERDRAPRGSADGERAGPDSRRRCPGRETVARAAASRRSSGSAVRLSRTWPSATCSGVRSAVRLMALVPGQQQAGVRVDGGADADGERPSPRSARPASSDSAEVVAQLRQASASGMGSGQLTGASRAAGNASGATPSLAGPRSSSRADTPDGCRSRRRDRIWHRRRFGLPPPGRSSDHRSLGDPARTTLPVLGHCHGPASGHVEVQAAESPAGGSAESTGLSTSRGPRAEGRGQPWPARDGVSPRRRRRLGRAGRPMLRRTTSMTSSV